MCLISAVLSFRPSSVKGTTCLTWLRERHEVRAWFTLSFQKVGAALVISSAAVASFEIASFIPALSPLLPYLTFVYCSGLGCGPCSPLCLRCCAFLSGLSLRFLRAAAHASVSGPLYLLVSAWDSLHISLPPLPKEVFRNASPDQPSKIEHPLPFF